MEVLLIVLLKLLCVIELLSTTQASSVHTHSHVHHLRGTVESPTEALPPIDPYNYTCTREERISGRCRWCNRDVPSTMGVWAPLPPYWQLPGECANQAFDVEDTRKCMKDRTLYVIGNSVPRQSAFQMVEMLGGNPVKREHQRDQCPKHATDWEDSCHSEIAGVKIKYLYMQFIDGFFYNDRGGFPYFRYQQNVDGKMKWVTDRLAYHNSTSNETKYYNDVKTAHAETAAEMWGGDNCFYQNTESCLARFFAGSTSRDILMFSAGMHYEVRAEGVEPTQAIGIDHRAWLTASAVSFRANIKASFKGQVFRVTMAEYASNQHLSHKSPYLARGNQLLNELWQPGAEDKPWYTIDQWPINHNRGYLYNDHVHFNGALTNALLHQVLNEMCPGGGKPAWAYNTNITEAFRQYKKAFVLHVAVTRFSYWSMILRNGVRHDIPNIDTLEGLEVPKEANFITFREDVEMFPAGPPVPACDKAWVPNTCKDTVYYKSLHGMENEG